MRGHTLDGAAVRLDNVSKQYRLRAAPHRSLVGELAQAAGRIRSSVRAPSRDRVPAERVMGAVPPPPLPHGRGSEPRWKEFWALQGLRLSVRPGEMLGVIGANGAGKSTLFKLIAGVTPPTRGWLAQRGRLGALIEVGAGIHPDLTGRENIYQYGAILGFSWREIRQRFDAIVEFADLGGFIDQPMKRYSSGMQMRLGFSVAVHVEPDVLLVDEVLAVGDQTFQTRCLERIDLLRSRGTAILFASHDLDAVERMCDRAIWLDHGRTVLLAPTSRVLAEYRAPNPSPEAPPRRGGGE